MPRKGRKPNDRPSSDEWFVYMVRCADGSLDTGITKDVARRYKQHDNGTASRYIAEGQQGSATHGEA